MRAIQKVIYCALEGTYGDKPVRLLLSQSNPKNKDGNFWCGRTSASMVWNYYQLIDEKGDSALIHNQTDKAPYNLVFPDGSFAALLEGSCAPGEVFKLLPESDKWAFATLYPFGATIKVDNEDVKTANVRNDPLDVETSSVRSSIISTRTTRPSLRRAYRAAGSSRATSSSSPGIDSKTTISGSTSRIRRRASTR